MIVTLKSVANVANEGGTSQYTSSTPAVDGLVDTGYDGEGLPPVYFNDNYEIFCHIEPPTGWEFNSAQYGQDAIYRDAVNTESPAFLNLFDLDFSVTGALASVRIRNSATFDSSWDWQGDANLSATLFPKDPSELSFDCLMDDKTNVNFATKEGAANASDPELAQVTKMYHPSNEYIETAIPLAARTIGEGGSPVANLSIILNIKLYARVDSYVSQMQDLISQGKIL